MHEGGSCSPGTRHVASLWSEREPGGEDVSRHKDEAFNKSGLVVLYYFTGGCL